jgi:hypothetical protein
VRIPNWDADAMDDLFYIGMPVHVWDEEPEVVSPPGPSREPAPSL